MEGREEEKEYIILVIKHTHIVVVLHTNIRRHGCVGVCGPTQTLGRKMKEGESKEDDGTNRCGGGGGRIQDRPHLNKQNL